MNSKIIDALIKLKWTYIVILLVLFFLVSWQTMRFIEPHSEMVKPKIYWWYYLNDVIGTGNSGYKPTTTGGRIAATFSSTAGNICLLTIGFKIVSQIVELSKRKKKGKAKMNCKNHVVLLGYRAGETDLVIRQLTSSKVGGLKIVLCSKHLTENPYDDKIDFVSGDTATKEVMIAASVATAKAVVISGHTDERTLMIGILVSKHVSPDCHVVAYFEDGDKARFLEMVAPSVDCMTSMRPTLIAQAILNPGSTKLFKNMADFDHSANFKLNIPAHVRGIEFHELMVALHVNYGAITVAYAQTDRLDAQVFLNPKQETIIRGGMSLFYIADAPIDEVVDWASLCPA